MKEAKFWINVGLLTVYVGLFAYLARFSSPTGDDFPNYNLLSLSNGIIQSVINYWYILGSRFTTLFVIQIGNSLGIMDNYYIHTLLAIALSLFSSLNVLTSFARSIST